MLHLPVHGICCFRRWWRSRACSARTFLCRPSLRTPWSLCKYTTRFSNKTGYMTTNLETQTVLQRNPWAFHFSALWSLLSVIRLWRRKLRNISLLGALGGRQRVYPPSLENIKNEYADVLSNFTCYELSRRSCIHCVMKCDTAIGWFQLDILFFSDVVAFLCLRNYTFEKR